jgi:hypothetical protein
MSRTQSNALLLVKSIPKKPRMQPEASCPDLVDLIGTNKTNKQPSFIDRFACNQ